MQRKILHIDMDAFYASVEQRDFPELRGKPVVVGGSPDSRGVVAACSYEARVFGVRSAMPCAKARRLCPDALFVRPRFDVYRACSSQLSAIFHEFTDLVEPLSLDEAYLDVTETAGYKGSGTLVAQEIKKLTLQNIGLIASAGVSYNKFLAKVASDVDKPDGLFVVTPEQADRFVARLPIRKFFGVGGVTEKRMKQNGIFTGADLKARSEAELCQLFGKVGRYYYRIARGIDDRPVNPDRRRKSLGTETTFEQDLTDKQAIFDVIDTLVADVAKSMTRRRLGARTLVLKVRYADFTLITRSVSELNFFFDQNAMQALIPGLVDKTELGVKPCRLLGVTVSNLSEEGSDVVHQPSLF